MRLLLAVLVLAGLLGCGGGDCVPRSGMYRVNFALRDGTCGVLSEQITPVDDTTPPAQFGCSGTRTKTADNCETTATSLRCPSSGAGSQITGKLTWDSGSTRGTGIGSMILFNASGTATCQGTYDVTYTKI